MIEPLSRRQWDVLKLILRVSDATGEAPTIRSIARSLNVCHHTVQMHLEALHRKGWLVTPSPDGMRCEASRTALLNRR
jgi:Mn-dependent DtxR family transcriptional regulator